MERARDSAASFVMFVDVAAVAAAVAADSSLT